jgi:hypothetical protein
MGKEIEPGKDPNMPMLGRWKVQEAPIRVDSSEFFFAVF